MRNSWIYAIGLLMMLLFSPYAHAGEAFNLETFFAIPQLDDLQKIIYLTVLAAEDYRQTVETVVKQPNRYYEMNPVLGKHPGRRDLMLFGAAGIAATAMISRINYSFARILVDSIIATEEANVWENEYAMDRRASMPIMAVMSWRF